MTNHDMLDNIKIHEDSDTKDPIKEVDSIGIDEFLKTRLMSSTKSVVFFTGAGFSKAWKNKYPLGLELFSVDDFQNAREKNNFFKLADDLLIKQPVNSGDKDKYVKDCYEYFTEIKFNLDIFRRYPSLLPNYLDSTLISAFEEEMKMFIRSRFEETVGKSEFNPKTKTGENKKIKKLFNEIYKHNNSIGFISTNYDFIIEKIYSNTNDLHFTRGIIDREMFSNKDWCANKVPLYKINGGFELYEDSDGFYLDYSERNKTPHIILPSKEQNYESKYYKTTFIKSADLLRQSDILVFIGYSLPSEDHTIQLLLKMFIDSHNKNKEVFIISKDGDSARKLTAKVANLFPSIAKEDAIAAVDGSLADIADLVK
ncbi:TPA: SIR2 family protein [Vibrio alginolyticus]|nr:MULTISPECIES: SIR2 family protein [Vibrio harveyi group]ELA9338829.1 SIR2 family protein [Vibrio parahaemolyticus]ELE6596815.1 SIR2 family protein [Vibrio alginolyticus]MBS9977794.1 SIR2 family protein [Vibrio alginolyticus]MCX8855193.1 SIR2 family protein [Vibrio parahaemolyticus]MCX8874868.1 SIR2 family protein [Vibrio parahaemolyticus]